MPVDAGDRSVSGARFALVLGGGGVTGSAFHQGVLEAMRAAGIEPADAEVIVGTSAGALVAARLRAPTALPAGTPATAPPAWGEEAGPALRRELGPLRHSLHRPRLPLGVLVTSLLPPGRRPLASLVAEVRRRHGDPWPQRPMLVCAVCRRTGRRVVFGAPGAPATDPATAVAASLAIPGYFRPVRIGGDSYVDGGTHSPTSADVAGAYAAGLDAVIVSSPMSVDPADRGHSRDLPLRMFCHRVLRRELAYLAGIGLPVIVVEPDRMVATAMGPNLMASNRAAQTREAARQRAAAVLSQRLPTALSWSPPGLR